jgi:hypothetical protein
MSKDELVNLERLMNYIAFHFLRKSKWEDVSKMEWMAVAAEFNGILQKQQQPGIRRIVQEPAGFGDNYFYEHLVIKKLKPWKARKPIAALSSPNFTRLNTITGALGYNSYIDFINNATDNFSFHELKINIPLAASNTRLLDHLVGYWYCYNRNLPERPEEQNGERVWRSAMEIYKSGGEYLVERTGKDHHMYYGKITSYADYVFIIMNSTTFIRQRHFIGRLKDVADNIRQPGFRVDQMNFVSTCVSFNEEPIALYEIFDRVHHVRDFEKTSVDLVLDSKHLPEHIRLHLKDARLNRITEH